MKTALLAVALMVAGAAGCGDIKLVADPSMVVPAPADAERAVAIVAASYGIPAQSMEHLTIYWYGGAALTCNDGGFIASDGHTCVGGEHQDGVIIVADDGGKISDTKFLPHELLHFYLQETSGDPDESHAGPAWGVDWNHPRGKLDIANDALIVAGM